MSLPAQASLFACRVWIAVACQARPLRALRANRGFGTDKKRIRTKTTVIGKNKRCLGIIQDRRSRTDALFIRARSVIRAAGTPTAQVPSPHLAV